VADYSNSNNNRGNKNNHMELTNLPTIHSLRKTHTHTCILSLPRTRSTGTNTNTHNNDNNNKSSTGVDVSSMLAQLKAGVKQKSGQKSGHKRSRGEGGSGPEETTHNAGSRF